MVCIYHGNCADGFGAAWVVRKALGEGVEFYAGVHQDDPPDVTGRDVLMVDFSYKYEILCEMSFKARSITVLDHHKTAAEDLERLPSAGKAYAERGGATEYCRSCNMPDIAALFDMERSGAGIAWDYFFPDDPRPALINHIEDRDLWRFALPGTREIQAAVFSYPYDFEVWDKLFDSFDEFGHSNLVTEGEAIERKHHKDIAELVQVVTRQMRIGGHVVPIANLPYTLTSDAGHLLCGEIQCPPGIGGPTTSRYPFAGCYWDTPEGRVFSLRSRDDGFDVGEIAKQYGGGGHKHASGFRVPFDQLDQFIP